MSHVLFYSKCARIKQDNKWQSQFNAILFAIDESGYVTSFCIGRTKSLTDMKEELQRISRQAPRLKTIFTGGLKYIYWDLTRLNSL
jgi:hypothetical protein